MKEIKIKIYGWSDFKKWFWDKFCFPRRQLVADWLTYHNSEARDVVEKYLIRYGKFNENSETDMENLGMVLRKYDEDIKEITSRTEKLIMLK